MGKKLSLVILALAILGGVYMFIFVLYSVSVFIYPNTLEFDIYNKDTDTHNVTVEIFSGGRKVFEGSYIIKPELSVYKNTRLQWGEYLIKISLDGKVYKYKAKVKPGYRLLAGGFTLIAFDIKNSNLSVHIISEGPPYVEVAEFVGEGSIFKKKFLFLEVYGVSSFLKSVKGQPTYHFDEEKKVIYLNSTLRRDIKLNESLKAIVGVGIKRCPSCSAISSHLEPIYSLPYTIEIDGVGKIEILDINEYGTVTVRFDDQIERIYVNGRWIEETKKRSWLIDVINHGFLDKDEKTLRHLKRF